MNITKQKQTHRYREQTTGYQWEGARVEEQDRGRGLRDTKLQRIKQISYKDILYRTGKYSHYSVMILNGV